MPTHYSKNKFQQEGEQRKTPTKNCLWDVKEILHNAGNVQCSILELTGLTINR